MMQFSFLAVCTLLVLIQTILVSSLNPGYDCDDVFIPKSRLTEVVMEARAAHNDRNSPSLMKDYLERYEGPPFRKIYLLWPVSSKTMHFKIAAKTQYRVVLDNDFQVFSVIMKTGALVKECRMREELNSLHNYSCGNTHYLVGELGNTVSHACPKITGFASKWSPVRYDGPKYEGSRKQLYITPIVTPFSRNKAGSDARQALVVFDNKCTVVGVVIKDIDSNYTKCKRWERRYS